MLLPLSQGVTAAIKSMAKKSKCILIVASNAAHCARMKIEKRRAIETGIEMMRINKRTNANVNISEMQRGSMAFDFSDLIFHFGFLI